MRQNPPTCQKSREEVLMENSFRTSEHFDDRAKDHFPSTLLDLLPENLRAS